MFQFFRQVVSSPGSSPAFKGRHLRANVFSLSPGTIVLPAATNHYVDINTLCVLHCWLYKTHLIPKYCIASTEVWSHPGGVWPSDSSFNWTSLPLTIAKNTVYWYYSILTEKQGIMKPFLHLASMILIAIPIKSWLNLFQYSMWPLRKVSCSAALSLSLFSQPKQQSISLSYANIYHKLSAIRGRSSHKSSGKRSPCPLF